MTHTDGADMNGPGPWPGPGYSLVAEEDGSEHWEPSWPDSPGSEPVEEDS